MIYIVLSLLLAIFHFLFFGSLLDLGTNAVFFAANTIFVFNAVCLYRKDSLYRFSLYFLGYLVFFIFIFGLVKSPLLFSLFIILYSPIFLTRRLLPYLCIFAVSVIFLTPYWLQTFLLLGLFYSSVLEVFKKTRSKFFTILFILGFVILSFIIFPILHFSLQVSPQTLLITLRDRGFQAALYHSLITSTVSTLIIMVFGIPLAYIMVRVDFRGKKIFDNLIDLPILIPQTVAGIALLVLLGPKSPLGEFIYKHCNIAIVGGYLGIIAAQIFVSSPFFIRSAMDAFDGVDVQLEDASRTLGASSFSTFWRVSLPLAAGGIFNGCILSWARALSEVGSLMVVAYRPMTVSVYLYDQFIQYGLTETQPIAVLLVIICLWAFIALRWFRYHITKQISRKGIKYAAPG